MEAFYYQILNDRAFHSEIDNYLYEKMRSLICSTISQDRDQLTNINLESIELSPMVNQKINSFIEWIHTNRGQHVVWLKTQERALLNHDLIGRTREIKLEIDP